MLFTFVVFFILRSNDGRKFKKWTELTQTPQYEKCSTAFKEKKLPKGNFTTLTFSLAIEWYHQNSRVVM